MSIDPKIAMILKIVLTLLQLVVNGTITLTGLVSPQTATLSIALCQIGISVIGIITSAYSSSEPGPLAPPDSAVVLAATRVADLSPTASSSDIVAAKSAANAAVARHMP